jgi:hypothetical protein
MKVLFEDRYGRDREIADVETKAEVYSAIAAFLKEFNFRSYYTRSWITEGENCFYVKMDVGSHSEFFKVPFETHAAAQAFIQEGLQNA